MGCFIFKKRGIFRRSQVPKVPGDLEVRTLFSRGFELLKHSLHVHFSGTRELQQVRMSHSKKHCKNRCFLNFYLVNLQMSEIYDTEVHITPFTSGVLVKGRNGGKQGQNHAFHDVLRHAHKGQFSAFLFFPFMLLLVAVVGGSSVMTTHRSRKPCDSASCYRNVKRPGAACCVEEQKRSKYRCFRHG